MATRGRDTVPKDKRPTSSKLPAPAATGPRRKTPMGSPAPAAASGSSSTKCPPNRVKPTPDASRPQPGKKPVSATDTANKPTVVRRRSFDKPTAPPSGARKPRGSLSPTPRSSLSSSSSSSSSPGRSMQQLRGSLIPTPRVTGRPAADGNSKAPVRNAGKQHVARNGMPVNTVKSASSGIKKPEARRGSSTGKEHVGISPREKVEDIPVNDGLDQLSAIDESKQERVETEKIEIDQEIVDVQQTHNRDNNDNKDEESKIESVESPEDVTISADDSPLTSSDSKDEGKDVAVESTAAVDSPPTLSEPKDDAKDKAIAAVDSTPTLSNPKEVAIAAVDAPPALSEPKDDATSTATGYTAAASEPSIDSEQQDNLNISTEHEEISPDAQTQATKNKPQAGDITTSNQEASKEQMARESGTDSAKEVQPKEEEGETTMASNTETRTKEEKLAEAPIPKEEKPAAAPARTQPAARQSAVSNDVIEETASKLQEQRKNRVRALAGAFETVISLQESKP
ncbi:uncharacterized protein LOC127255485 [Andrographis paniculata]|uniref:uncharacterized protein LOC127255485 n=1 Tax=Andrographis paniculata TaxID=175694 RepID=UPI0021E7BE99|nr:uncharacterized protein LOC127255485 [Andrographis paniculata]